MKPIGLISLVLSILILAACEPEADLFQQFVIPKGKHAAANRSVQSLQSDVLSFDAKFNSTARYDFKEDGFQDSKNKLLGFADCNSMHHENSARFGWQWFNNRLEIYAYCYVNSNRVEKFIGVAELDEVNHYEIRLRGNEYIFQFNDEEPIAIERGNVCNQGVYYMLWPYFGGTLPAPHTVSIDVRINY
jgi:hypothetical protein